MSKKLSELQAGALNAWTPVQQAALYHQHMVEQYERDEKAKLKEITDKEKKEKSRAKGEVVDHPKPDEVSATRIVDDLVLVPSLAFDVAHQRSKGGVRLYMIF